MSELAHYREAQATAADTPARRTLRFLLQPAALGLLLALLAAALLGNLFHRQAATSLVSNEQTRIAILEGSALADFVAGTLAANPEDAAALQAAMLDWVERSPGDDSIRVVRLGGARLLASTRDADRDGELPRRLASVEKWLFVLGEVLRGAADTRIGNTRYDIWGGQLPWVNLVARIVGGGRMTENGFVVNESMDQFILKFLRNKLSPPAALGVDLLAGGKTAVGQKVDPLEMREWNGIPVPYGLLREGKRRLMPMVMQDITEAIKDTTEDGWSLERLLTGTIKGLPSGVGIGTTSYRTESQRLQEAYDKQARAEGRKPFAEESMVLRQSFIEAATRT